MCFWMIFVTFYHFVIFFHFLNFDFDELILVDFDYSYYLGFEFRGPDYQLLSLFRPSNWYLQLYSAFKNFDPANSIRSFLRFLE